MHRIAFCILLASGLCGETSEARLHKLEALLDGSAFVRIRPGTFRMGSEDGKPDERPVRRVAISQGFEMGKFEVTQAQWISVMRRAHAKDPAEENNPSQFKGLDLPVESVSWNDVQQFLRLLNARDANHTYRLPTEAEWEYACRAGSKEDHVRNLDELAWYESTADGKTHEVGAKKPNAWGLYDMHGNVAEWVSDWYSPDYGQAGAKDPTGPAGGSYKVYRGGGWFSAPKDSGPASRGFNFPNDGFYSVGFRLVRTTK